MWCLLLKQCLIITNEYNNSLQGDPYYFMGKSGILFPVGRQFYFLFSVGRCEFYGGINTTKSYNVTHAISWGNMEYYVLYGCTFIFSFQPVGANSMVGCFYQPTP